MKQNYIKPTTEEIEICIATMLAYSTDRIPVGGGTKPPAANERDYMEEDEWGSLWEKD